MCHPFEVVTRSFGCRPRPAGRAVKRGAETFGKMPIVSQSVWRARYDADERAGQGLSYLRCRPLPWSGCSPYRATGFRKSPEADPKELPMSTETAATATAARSIRNPVLPRLQPGPVDPAGGRRLLPGHLDLRVVSRACACTTRRDLVNWRTLGGIITERRLLDLRGSRRLQRRVGARPDLRGRHVPPASTATWPASPAATGTRRTT